MAADSIAEILGTAQIELDGAVGAIEVDLRIRNSNGTIEVQEQIPGTRYPKTCHERHLQSDEHFCIGMDAGKGIVSRDHAVVWWGLLERFLRLQRVAQRTRKWPPQQEMAHGHAGPHQIAALSAARQLGIEDEYMRMLEGEEAWFGSKWPKLDGRGKMRNGRARCPAGCTRKGRPILRVDCCCQQEVPTLLREERLRRKKVADFYVSARSLGEQCCGTMLKCPLRDGAGECRGRHSLQTTSPNQNPTPVIHAEECSARSLRKAPVCQPQQDDRLCKVRRD